MFMGTNTDKCNQRKSLRVHKAAGGCVGNGCEHPSHMADKGIEEPSSEMFAHGGKVDRTARDREHMKGVHEKQVSLARKHYPGPTPEQEDRRRQETELDNKVFKRIDKRGPVDISYGPNDPVPKFADGGKVKDEIEEVEMHEGGDDAMVDAVCDELCEAIEKKDKKGIAEAIKALVMSAMGE